VITDDIINLCIGVRKGIEPTAWIIPYSGTTVVFDSTNPYEITTLLPNQKWFPKITATKFGLNAGSTIVTSEVKEDAFKHTFQAVIGGLGTSERLSLDTMDGIIVIVKRNTLTTDTRYAVYGAQHGLWKSSHTQMANDNSSMVTATYESRTDMEEDYSEYTMDFGTGQTDEILATMLSVDSVLGIVSHTVAKIDTLYDVTSDGATDTMTVVAIGFDKSDNPKQTVAMANTVLDNDFYGTVYVYPQTGQTYTFATS
jgi:hypothetical protein